MDQVTNLEGRHIEFDLIEHMRYYSVFKNSTGKKGIKSNRKKVSDGFGLQPCQGRDMGNIIEGIGRIKEK